MKMARETDTEQGWDGGLLLKKFRSKPFLA